MSQITIKSPKHCATKQGFKIERNYKKLYFAFSASFTTILLLLLLIWFILHPSKPQFSLKEVDIYQFNLSGPMLNSSIQLTLLSKNPNQKVSIYYDEFQVYATYKGQRITGDSSVPPFYQGNEESNLLTASLIGNGLPVAPSLGYEVGRDQINGRLVLNLRVIGKLRWKIGTWVSGHYRFNVNCVSVMAFGPSMLGAPLISAQGAQCSTTV
ncbi:NDR1/HIN1-like protein 26 [Lotus japonicus]|uniref:Late embryogenesis abundant protein LEA-2 subgroup domain-containing protein n=1 Tax=Lotus japonicus TaxID=34305 RepID=I3S5T1_LOTJA|nr:NDR1/HIN1-like protein 26 [Lotus japonicus]AFK35623.1 unknown [Lotus japonicus]